MCKWIKLLISLGVIGLLLAILPWRETWRAMSQVSLSTWLLVLLGFCGGHLLGAFKWRLMINVGRAKLSPFEAVKCYAAGLFSNLCLPTMVGGDIVRATLAGRITGQVEAVVLGGIADRLIDLIATGLLIGVAGLMIDHHLPGWWGPLFILGMLLATTVAGIGLVGIMARRLSAWPRRYRRRIAQVLLVLRTYRRRPQRALAALSFSILIQSEFILLNAWVGREMGIAVSNAVWFLTWTLAKLAGMLPISLGGLGVRDATLTTLLVPFGVAPTAGLAVSLIWQSVLIAGGMLSGLFWLAFEGKNSGDQAAVNRPDSLLSDFTQLPE